MSRKKFTKEFKLKLLKGHDEQGVSFWKLGKQYGIEASIITNTFFLKMILQYVLFIQFIP